MDADGEQAATGRGAAVAVHSPLAVVLLLKNARALRRVRRGTLNRRASRAHNVIVEEVRSRSSSAPSFASDFFFVAWLASD